MVMVTISSLRQVRASGNSVRTKSPNIFVAHTPEVDALSLYGWLAGLKLGVWMSSAKN